MLFVSIRSDINKHKSDEGKTVETKRSQKLSPAISSGVNSKRGMSE